MTTEELRLECLRLAQQAGTESATEVVERAKAYSDYVLGADPAAVEPKPLERRAWTDEQTAEAVRLYGEGLSARQIADRMGRLRGGVEQQITKTGARRRHRPLRAAAE